MNDTPEGPGWWRASDGRWYPPALRPVPAGVAAPVGVAAPADGSAADAATLLATAPSDQATAPSDQAPAAVLEAPVADGEPVSEGLFRRMLRTVVEHYVSATETPARPATRGLAVDVDASSVSVEAVVGASGEVDGESVRPGRRPTVDPTADPFEPIPEHPAPSPLSLRRRTPRRAWSSGESDFVPPATGMPTRGAAAGSQPTVRQSVAPVPASPVSITLRRHRLLPWGTVALVLLLALAAALVVALGGYWYQGRTAAHRSPVNAAEAFVKALYGNSPATAQSLVIPGQHLDVSTHPQAPVAFGATSVVRDGADHDVDVVACMTGVKRCGFASPDSTTLAVPTRAVGGSWYVDESQIAYCTGQAPAHEVVVCQG